MNYERSGRRTFRRSPGRQYGYEFDPLRSQTSTGNGQSERLGASPRSEPLTGYLKDTDALDEPRGTGTLAPRPDPRRTRQLLRKQILATKARGGDDTGQLDPEIDMDQDAFDEDQSMYEDDYRPVPRGQRRSGSVRFQSAALRPRRPTGDFIEPVESDEVMGHLSPLPYEDELDLLDPDLGYDDDYDPLAERVGYREDPRAYVIEQEPVRPEVGKRRSAPLAEPDIQEEEERGSGRKKKKKGFLSRRKLIAGAILVGGGAVAAYELGPKLPQALENAGSNIEHQIQDAFNRGFAAGGEAVRKELINGLDTLEGVSLDGAIGAAKLTRVAYDVFVSPIVTLAATIADDFLAALLNALIKARGWLQQINADNATLVALTSVLQSWVNQVHVMPKKLQAITDTDLDSAQTYLNALQRKIQTEQAKLNGQATPTTGTPNPKATGTPGH